MSKEQGQKPWWSRPPTAVTPVNGFTRIFRAQPASRPPSGRRVRLADQGQTLSQSLDSVPIGLSHLYPLLSKASSKLTISRAAARDLLAHLVAELLDEPPVDAEDDAALLSALADLAQAEPGLARSRTYLDHVYTTGLPMAEAAEFVGLVDAELRAFGVQVKLMIRSGSALALIMGMVRG